MFNSFLKLFFFTYIIINVSNCSDDSSKKSEKVIVKEKSEQKDHDKTKERSTKVLDFTTIVEFIKPKNETVQLLVALSNTPEERNAGLMGIESLKQNHGMLFVFDKNQPLSFWMANTPLSLDIIFVNDDYKIVRIHSNTEPFSTKQYESGENATYVIETIGGFCIENDILEGSTVGFDI
ncbi:MAG: DUF192 domain-containing protein [Bacteroidetes bacterium]|nr:DUF192 domain-containing protein [Bacteroidota bacterium]NCQ12231.1 DUF192 domain-containing protein [Bacteroidota bacterium]